MIYTTQQPYRETYKRFEISISKRATIWWNDPVIEEVDPYSVSFELNIKERQKVIIGSISLREIKAHT